MAKTPIATEGTPTPASLTNAFLMAMATHAGTLGADISLHSADPGSTGANEIAGTTRVPTTWGPAAMNGPNAEITGTDVNFSVPASTSCTHYGVWNGATFQYGTALAPPVTTGAGAAAVVIVTPKYQEQPGV